MKKKSPETANRCDCCRSEVAAAIQLYPGPSAGPLKGNEFWLCDFCATTFASNMMMYPRHYDGQLTHIIQAVCHVGNAIIAQLKELQESRKER